MYTNNYYVCVKAYNYNNHKSSSVELSYRYFLYFLSFLLKFSRQV